MNRGKNKTVAGVLGILLGTLGVHHFYLGSYMAGAILLAVSLLSFGTLCWISLIIGIVEGVMLLVMKPEDFDARYNQRQPASMEFAFMKAG